jgi:hypothetical protein
MQLKLLLSFFFVVFSPWQVEERVWELKVHKHGIRIYTRTAAGSPMKELKVQCNVDATLAQVVAVLLDINTAPQWVYATRSATLLKQVSPSELYYHSEIEIPWPASNRDFIAHLKVTQDPVTRIVTVDGPTIPDYMPQQENVVRVPKGSGKWILTPAGQKQVNIEYYLMTDPGGSIPAWLVNMFCTKGPLESFQKLKTHLESPAYREASLPFIHEGK